MLSKISVLGTHCVFYKLYVCMYVDSAGEKNNRSIFITVRALILNSLIKMHEKGI